MSDGASSLVTSSTPPAWTAWLQAAVRVLWLYALPALLAGLTLRYLIPEVGVGVPGAVERLAHSAPVLAFAGLFVAFSALAHYWRHYLPDGRGALPPLPDHLSEGRDAPSHPAEGAASALRKRTFVLGAWTFAAVVLVLGLIALARRMLAEPYEVVSSSMVPTFEPGDRILANKRAYRSSGPGGGLPSRGDIIVFQSRAVGLGPGTWPETLVKRVIGLPGDRIDMQGGSPVINGWTVPSCHVGRYVQMIEPSDDIVEGSLRMEFLGGETYLTVRTAAMPGLSKTFVVGPGQVFVLGDNRANSLDSRSWNAGRGGSVPVAAIDGRAQWFLVGAAPSGGADFGRFLQKVGGVVRPPGGGLAKELDDGIARCLAEPPAITTPPELSSWHPARATGGP